jgi:hypothetical protein
MGKGTKMMTHAYTITTTEIWPLTRVKLGIDKEVKPTLLLFYESKCKQGAVQRKPTILMIMIMMKHDEDHDVEI